MDEKGRLFGKINIIDLTIIVFCIFILPIFYYGGKLYKKHQETIHMLELELAEEIRRNEFPEIEFNCLFLDVKPEIIHLIKVGDEEKEVSKDTIIHSPAKIIHCWHNKSDSKLRIIVAKTPKPTESTILL